MKRGTVVQDMEVAVSSLHRSFSVSSLLLFAIGVLKKRLLPVFGWFQ
jgi:hypothetical protein